MRTTHTWIVVILLVAATAPQIGCDSSGEDPLPVATFSADEVAGMDVTQAGETTTFLVNEERRWFRHSEGRQHTHFSGAKATTHRHVQTDPVDDQLIGGAIERLASLKAAGVPEEEVAGIEDPSLTIALRRQPDNSSPFLMIYLSPSRTASGAYYMRASTNEQTFLVSRQKIAPVLELLNHMEPAIHQH